MGIRQTSALIFSQLNFLSHGLLSPRAEERSLPALIEIKTTTTTTMQLLEKTIKIALTTNVELHGICELGLKMFLE